MTDDDDFLSRWSRRKRRIAQEEEAQPAEPESPPQPEAEPETAEEEAELLARLDLPVPESLKAGDDFTVFMRAGVPEFLRRRALRVLWRSNPVLANLDGLNDYDDDYTSPEMTKKVLATAYKVGRGFLKDPKDPEILQDKDEKLASEAVRKPDPEAEKPAESEAAQPAPEELSESVSEIDEEPEKSLRPKRMRFES